MKLFMKKLLAVTLTVTLILSGTVTAFGADSKGIQLQFNGEDITASGAAKIVDGRVMVPLRQTLEAMGVEDKENLFTAGEKDMVSVRFIAETLGYGVGWDVDDKTVVIIDPAALFTNADTEFSIISKLMKSDLDLEKAYATTGQFDMDITTYADPQSIMPGLDFSVSGKMTGVQQKSNADLVMSLAFQFDKMLSKLTAEEKTQMEPLLNMFKNANMKIKMDGETGITYMNSSLFSAIDPTVGANTWYKMNVYDTYEEMGIDLKSISNMSYSDVKLSEMLTASFSSMEYADTATYQDMKTTYTFLKNLIGDGAFAKKTAGSYVTYTLNITQVSVLAALTKTALAEGISKDTMDLTEVGDLLNTSKIGANIMIKEKAGSLYEYGLKGSCSLEDVNCSFDMTGDQKNAEGQITIDQKDLVKMMIEVESHITETSKAPDLSLPSDAVVVDYPM
ncbi:MAG TPA: copper amine oxidase N-terminal domain-containing protein [Anaerovoracaceae bacterium]|nr:copper amine oxidase N-terminal domain-containing protein [Anaerovoracaceae bacterium]